MNETPDHLKSTITSEPRRLPFSARDSWRLRRQDMELRKVKSHPRVLSPRRWDLIGRFLRAVFFVMRCLGLLRIAGRTALDIEPSHVELSFPNLPPEFDGYRILHITDPHFDMVDGITTAILGVLPRDEVDATFFTGDYRNKVHGEHKQILDPLAKVCRSIRSRDGIYVTLGNHDTQAMVPDFEALGLRVLINETVVLKRGSATLTLTGLDDVHYYYTEQALEALAKSGTGFKIALIHSNEMSSEAAALGYSLYLNGHTHGGQVCLPNGVPVITHTDTPRSMARGLWRAGEMLGYSNRGAGVIGLPLRLFCRGEVLLLTLRRSGGSV